VIGKERPFCGIEVIFLPTSKLILTASNVCTALLLSRTKLQRKIEQLALIFWGQHHQKLIKLYGLLAAREWCMSFETIN